MAKQTLLSIVQNILSDMDSDEVNSINDTIEAYQVALIVKTTYEDIIDSRYWPNLETLGVLTASGDSAKPTHMQVPSEADRLLWLKYNIKTSTDTKEKFEDITYMEPKEFVDYCMSRNSDDSTVDTVTDNSGVQLLITNNTAPLYYTSFDDDYLVFDSYDSDVDTTLQSSKSQIMYYKSPTFSMLDTFVPDLPSKAFSFLLAESKSTCFVTLRLTPNAKEEQKSRRQRTRLARDKWVVGGGIKKANYGRK